MLTRIFTWDCGRPAAAVPVVVFFVLSAAVVGVAREVLDVQRIFLDTVRLAERTDDLLAVVWKYIQDGKLADTTVLLLAAQKNIRTGSSLKENGSCTTHGDGFMIISNLCIKDVLAINLEIAQNRKGKKQKVERNLGIGH